MQEMTPRDAAQLSPLGLAYIGDGVYELLARRHILEQGNRPVQKLHRATVEIVRASAQSRAADLIRSGLSDEETAVYQRGRNADSHPTKNADAADYCRATGLEALFGYLFLTGRNARLAELFAIICGAANADREGSGIDGKTEADAHSAQGGA